MKRPFFGLILFALAALAPWPQSSAFVAGPTNFIGNYQDHWCNRPWPPITNDDHAWRWFLDDVERYQACIQEYVEAANNDIRRINEKANAAIEEFNSFVDSLR